MKELSLIVQHYINICGLLFLSYQGNHIGFRPSSLFTPLKSQVASRPEGISQLINNDAMLDNIIMDTEVYEL